MTFKSVKAIAGSIALGAVALGVYTATATEQLQATSTKKFVKTTYRCSKGNCKCSGYWGTKHNSGTYEGNCTNSDGYRHTCGHGPEAHGLRRY